MPVPPRSAESAAAFGTVAPESTSLEQIYCQELPELPGGGLPRDHSHVRSQQLAVMRIRQLLQGETKM